MKEIAIIIINYNTSSYTIKCVESILTQVKNSTSFEIIIIDNNSKPDDYFFLVNHLPKKPFIKIHRSPKNLGFGGGNMLGIQFINAKYILFLNNDTLFKNNAIKHCIEFLAKNEEFGLCTAQNYNQFDKFVISFDHFKGLRKLIFGRQFLEKFWPHIYPKRNHKYNQPVKVNFINGAFMLFKKSAFENVGGFDTKIFLYFEEMDICLRLLNSKLKSALVPSAQIIHYQGLSTKNTPKTIIKEGLISYLYVIDKNYNFLKKIFIRLYYIITFIVKPKKWFLYPLFFTPSPITKSLMRKQKIYFDV